MWRSEDKLGEWNLSLSYVVPRDWICAIQLGSRYPHFLCYLNGPIISEIHKRDLQLFFNPTCPIPQDSNLQIETFSGALFSLGTLPWNYLWGADFPGGCVISMASSLHPCHQDILSFWTGSSAVRVGRTSAPSVFTFAPLCGPTVFPVILTSSPAGLIFIFLWPIVKTSSSSQRNHPPTPSIVIVEISSKPLLPKAQSLELWLTFSSYPMLN